MPHIRYTIDCPGCGRSLSGPTFDTRRKRILVHVRNCALAQQAVRLILDAEAKATEGAP